MFLRKVTKEDAKILFDWANDSETRQNSFSTEPIPWENHLSWLDGKLADENCFFYIGMNEAGEALGTIRFDYQAEKESAVLSYSVAPKHRGNGYGAVLLSLGETQIAKEKGCLQIMAEVKTSNGASRKCFLKNGYQELETTEEEIVFGKMTGKSV